MACFFCDSTPMTNNAVEHLAAIRMTLGVGAEMEPAMILSRIQDILNHSDWQNGTITELHKQIESMQSHLSAKDTIIGGLYEEINQLNTRVLSPPMASSRLSSSPTRMGGEAGRDLPWYARNESWRKRNRRFTS
jgi:hypothetical protein